LLGADGDPVAVEGDIVIAVGGFLPDGDPRIPTGSRMFFAAEITRASGSRHDRDPPP
jgi:hypothetical protein